MYLYNFNPCCSGQWSSTLKGKCIWFKVTLVLILVVVDNGLVQMSLHWWHKVAVVLILVVVDNGLVLDIIRHY